MTPIETAHRSLQVTRYHSKPEINKLGQTTADHTAGMLAMLYQLNPAPSSNLVKAITFHDAPELFGGDLSYHFKRAHPDFTKEHERLSDDLARENGLNIVQLSRSDQKWHDFLDRLETIFYVKIHRPDVLRDQSWIDMKHGLIDMAKELGCYEGRHGLSEFLVDERDPDMQAAPGQKDAQAQNQLRIDLIEMLASDEVLVGYLAEKITGNAWTGMEVIRRHLSDVRQKLECLEEVEPDQDEGGKSPLADLAFKPVEPDHILKYADRYGLLKDYVIKYTPGERQAEAERPVMNWSLPQGRATGSRR